MLNNEKDWAVFCHVAAFAGYLFPFGNVIGPLVLWLMKKDEMEFVRIQGKEVLNFQITISIAYVVTALLLFVFIGYLLLPLVGLLSLIFTIMGIIKTSEGQVYYYPFSIKFIQ